VRGIWHCVVWGSVYLDGVSGFSREVYLINCMLRISGSMVCVFLLCGMYGVVGDGVWCLWVVVVAVLWALYFGVAGVSVLRPVCFVGVLLMRVVVVVSVGMFFKMSSRCLAIGWLVFCDVFVFL